MAIYSNLTMDQGSDFQATIDVNDSSGNNLNLTGYSVAGQMRKSYASSTATNFTAAITNATNGVLSISLSAAQTNALKAGRYVYDVEISFNDSSGNTIVERILEGKIQVTPSVTK